MPPFGHLSYYRPGDTFRNRLELSASGVRRPRRAGVAGTRHEGAESIVLADQYEDDEYGEAEINYAGQGGRDPQTGRQPPTKPPRPATWPCSEASKPAGPCGCCAGCRPLTTAPKMCTATRACIG